MRQQVNIKIDSRVKKEAQARAHELGLSLSSVVNATLMQFAKTGELNLSASPKMTSFLERIVIEARREYKSGKSKGPFRSARRMIEDLDS